MLSCRNPNHCLSSTRSLQFYFSWALLIILILSNSAYAGDLLRGPHSPPNTTPERHSGNTESSPDIPRNIVSAPTLFFRKFMSPYWGYDCSHVPSCSRYSLLAIEKHGPVVGCIMTFDRLQHEANEARYSPLIRINGGTYVYDPIENNDFWWHQE